ncbi:MAG: dihydrofolate reductase [Streptococcaceae bacterium]|jgi:dihydrofolate reductase|nr:dihydrofolate reductase [Streptococcaceae bacterium]
MKKICGIWAEDRNGLIGVDGKLPWRLPKELQHFKTVTMGAALLSGRKTFDGMNHRLLPGRETLILSRDKDLYYDGVTVLHSREEVLDWFASQDKDLFVQGGADLFSLFSADIELLYRTLVEGEFTGDTYFPADFPIDAFEMVSSERVKADEKNPYDFTLFVYKRKGWVEPS